MDIFKSKIPVCDILDDSQKLFERFFERKNESDWLDTNFNATKNTVVPHMEMKYSDKDNDYIIKANYNFSAFDSSVINIYFMNDTDIDNINDVINKYLAGLPKRKIDISIPVDDDKLYIGKYIAIELIIRIWNNYLNKLILSFFNIWTFFNNINFSNYSILFNVIFKLILKSFLLHFIFIII